MICQNCGGKAYNKQTVSRKNGMVWRRYECSQCGTRFSTYEMYKQPDKREIQHREYSMPCPVCNGFTNIVESRIKTDGSYRRMRVCAECGARFSTTERLNVKRQQPKRPSVEKFLDVALKRYQEV